MPPPTAFGSRVPPNGSQSRTTGAAAAAPPKAGSRFAPSKAAAAAASQLGELTTENAQLKEAQEALRAQCAASGEAQAEAQRSLALALEREGDLAVLLASAGNDAMAVKPIDWTVAEARDALQQDAEHELSLNRFSAKVAAGRESMKQLLEEQRELQASLAELRTSTNVMVQCA